MNLQRYHARLDALDAHIEEGIRRVNRGVILALVVWTILGLGPLVWITS